MMVWTLNARRKKIKVLGRRVFGRADFPEEAAMSRQHFEIDIEDNRVFLRDLDSTHGTLVDGKTIAPQSRMELRKGSQIEIGKTKIVLLQPSNHLAPWIDICIFLSLAVGNTALPTMDYGRSVGGQGLALLIGIMALAVMVSALMWRVFSNRLSGSVGGRIVYALLVIVTSVALNDSLLAIADYQWKIGDDLVVTKINHFCLVNFKQSECARHINLCPQCVLRIDRWQRDQIAARLKTYRAQYPEDAKKALLQQSPENTRTPANRGP